jgi:hypothetical protein
MPPAETAGNQQETACNHQVHEEMMMRRLDHLDDLIHGLDQRVRSVQEFIDEHRPALARGLALMDPGARVRAFMGKGKTRD